MTDPSETALRLAAADRMRDALRAMQQPLHDLAALLYSAQHRPRDERDLRDEDLARASGCALFALDALREVVPETDAAEAVRP